MAKAVAQKGVLPPEDILSKMQQVTRLDIVQKKIVSGWVANDNDNDDGDDEKPTKKKQVDEDGWAATIRMMTFE